MKIPPKVFSIPACALIVLPGVAFAHYPLDWAPVEMFTLWNPLRYRIFRNRVRTLVLCPGSRPCRGIGLQAVFHSSRICRRHARWHRFGFDRHGPADCRDGDCAFAIVPGRAARLGPNIPARDNPWIICRFRRVPWLGLWGKSRRPESRGQIGHVDRIIVVSGHRPVSRQRG